MAGCSAMRRRVKIIIVVGSALVSFSLFIFRREGFLLATGENTSEIFASSRIEKGGEKGTNLYRRLEFDCWQSLSFKFPFAKSSAFDRGRRPRELLSLHNLTSGRSSRQRGPTRRRNSPKIYHIYVYVSRGK